MAGGPSWNPASSGPWAWPERGPAPQLSFNARRQREKNSPFFHRLTAAESSERRASVMRAPDRQRRLAVTASVRCRCRAGRLFYQRVKRHPIRIPPFTKNEHESRTCRRGDAHCSLADDLKPVRRRSPKIDTLLPSALCGLELALYLAMGLPSFWWKLGTMGLTNRTGRRDHGHLVLGPRDLAPRAQMLIIVVAASDWPRATHPAT
jgi:hypothetical protein